MNFQASLDDEAAVLSQNIDIQDYGIAGRIWEAAYALILFVDPPPIWEFNPQCSISHGCGAVVELGAGTGFLGLKLARVLSMRQPSATENPKTIVLTDLGAVCPLLERNRQKDTNLTADLLGVHLRIRPLEWGSIEHGFQLGAELESNLNDGPVISHDRVGGLLSHIVCSDLVYFTELFAPLLRTLLQLSSPPFSSAAQPVEVIISYMTRSLSKESPFWAAFGVWFNFSPVLVRHKSASVLNWQQFGSHEDDAMFIFVATRKQESLPWAVPDDLALMRGSDDTFETLLLMNISNVD